MAQSSANRKRETIIDENLKKVYEQTLEEGVPDRFTDLLKALKQQDNTGRSSNEP